MLVVKNGKILVGERSDNKTLCGPGGHLHETESPKRGAIREAIEEFSVEPLNLIPLGKMDAVEGMYNNTWLYLCDNFKGNPAGDTVEISNVRWLTMEELSKEELFPAFEESLNILKKALARDKKDGIINADGGKGSGNWGHKGVKGKEEALLLVHHGALPVQRISSQHY